MTDLPPRLVTLVVHEPRGVLPSFEVTVPWWQEAAPVNAEAEQRFGVPFTVLRLLYAEGPFPGGDVAYLVDAPGIDSSLLEPWPHQLSESRFRVSYARAEGVRDLLAWAETALAAANIEVIAAPVQERSWNLAGTWRLESSEGPLWLKATPDFLGHEAALLEALGPTGLVPPLIAGRRGASLMRHVGGVDGYGLTTEQFESAIEVLCELQHAVDSLPFEPQVDRFLDAAPEFDFFEMEASLLRLRETHGASLDREESAAFDTLLDELADRVGAASVVRTTLVHGDFHGGNLRLRAEAPPIVLDWGDSFFGNPLFDLDCLRSYDMADGDRLERVWLDRLADRIPSNVSADIDEAWEALRPIAALRLALVYQHFCDHIEPAERRYHADDILPALRSALTPSQHNGA